MRAIPKFIVLTSLNVDEEGNRKKSCLIVIDTQNKLTEFADYLERNSMLSVESIFREEKFFFTVGTFYSCGVLEVHLKEETGVDTLMSCEQVAISETYSFLNRSALLDD